MNSNIALVLQNATNKLIKQSDTARLDAEILLAFVLKKNRTWIYTWPEMLLTDEQLQVFETLISQREDGVPIAYLTGTKSFWSLDLYVTPDTLIPRPETEMLVQITLDFLKSTAKPQILDAGTGSGAIALALAKERPDSQINACDRSEKALEVAKTNALNLKVSNIEFYLSDWFQGLPSQKYHAIIANPPYISPADPHLEAGDLRFEPKSALVSAEDGYQDLEKLIKESSKYLISGGLLLLEHGYNQKSGVESLLNKYHYQSIHCWKDMQGLDRISQGIWYS